MKISFIIPCLNEEKNIELTLNEVKKIGLSLDVLFEIIVVNDGSTDNTKKIVENYVKNNYKDKNNITLVSNIKNLGFGGAYKVGIAHAAGEYVLMIPGDNSHSKAGVMPILNLIGTKDIIIPYPINIRARSYFRRKISMIYTILLNYIFKIDIPYYNGLVLHNRILLNSITINTNSFAYQTEALIKLIYKNCSYTTVPVLISERNSGGTSAFKLVNIIKVIYAILMIKILLVYKYQWCPVKPD
jgi:glycosyltransferase involved in cell wall biosynthesis